MMHKMQNKAIYLAGPLKAFAITVSCLFVLGGSAVAQTSGNEVTIIQLGSQRTVIPAPDGFEEATSQFEAIKDRFTRTEGVDNDTLAVHLSHADCDKLRGGASAALDLYTKISVRRAVREVDYSAERFADLVATFRSTGAKILDFNNPAMKDTLERLQKSLSEVNKKETQVDLSQPVNLGEFDTRPNVYAVMLLINFKTRSGNREVTTPILGGLCYVRVNRRLIYVYTYRRYSSPNDIEGLRDFTRQWIGKILAANPGATATN